MDPKWSAECFNFKSCFWGAVSSSIGAPSSQVEGTIDLGSVGSTGVLIITGGSQFTDRVINLAGGGVLDQSGQGQLLLSGSVTSAGGTPKTLTLQGSTSGTGEIFGMIFNHSAALHTSLIKRGTGKWTLSGANTYSGGPRLRMEFSGWRILWRLETGLSRWWEEPSKMCSVRP